MQGKIKSFTNLVNQKKLNWQVRGNKDIQFECICIFISAMATNVLSYPLLLYFSMDLTEGQRKCAFGSSPVLFTITIICYAIVMGVGWVLAIREEPGQPLILAGAIVSTIPVLSLVLYLCFAFTFSEACEDDSCIKFGIFTIQSCAGLVQMIGAACTVYCSWCYTE